MTPQPLRLVIWDCDGVLVDSEGPSARVTAAECTRLGWAMTPNEALQLFTGIRLSDMPPLLEAQTGRPVPPGWVEHVRAQLIETLGRDLELMPGAAETLRATSALGLPYRVASNSSHEEMAAKFARTGLTSLVEGRLHSARDVPRGKPAPDVFLAAAAAEGVPPAACIVVEDSFPGIAAACAAGMAVLGLDPHGDGAAARAAGAHPIHSLSECPALFRAAMRAAA
ncbi:MAG: HAD family hydrolase [Janthinobacterium lividum]